MAEQIWVGDDFQLELLYYNAAHDDYSILGDLSYALATDTYIISTASSGQAYQWYFTEEVYGEDKSLGGGRIGSPLSGSDVDLFDDTKTSQNYSGFTRYRCLMAYAGSTLHDPKIWFTPPTGMAMYFWLSSSSSVRIPTETSEPPEASWTAVDGYDSYANGYVYPGTGFGSATQVWVKLVITGELTLPTTLGFGFGGTYG